MSKQTVEFDNNGLFESLPLGRTRGFVIITLALVFKKVLILLNSSISFSWFSNLNLGL